MNILLLNTSTYVIEYGFFENDKVIFEKSIENEFNSDLLTYLLHKSFKEYDKRIKSVEAVSLVNGPGSFTGLRVGSSVAKGICSVTNSLLIEINTLDLICNKFKKEFDKNMTVIPLIPSNTKEKEFYFAEYNFENDRIKRIGEYKIGKFENIYKKKNIYLINENINYNFPVNSSVFNMKNFSNIKSQFELTEEKILRKEVSDYKTSEPFYIKKFIPLKK